MRNWNIKILIVTFGCAAMLPIACGKSKGSVQIESPLMTSEVSGIIGPQMVAPASDGNLFTCTTVNDIPESRILWTASAGTFEKPVGKQIHWKAPSEIGEVTLSCSIAGQKATAVLTEFTVLVAYKGIISGESRVSSGSKNIFICGVATDIPNEAITWQVTNTNKAFADISASIGSIEEKQGRIIHWNAPQFTTSVIMSCTVDGNAKTKIEYNINVQSHSCPNENLIKGCTMQGIDIPDTGPLIINDIPAVLCDGIKADDPHAVNELSSPFNIVIHLPNIIYANRITITLPMGPLLYWFDLKTALATNDEPDSRFDYLPVIAIAPTPERMTCFGTNESTFCQGTTYTIWFEGRIFNRIMLAGVRTPNGPLAEVEAFNDADPSPMCPLN
jgi:hypothetical protein